MIFRYLVIAIISLITISIFLLPKTNLKLPIYSKSQIKANTQNVINPPPILNDTNSQPPLLTARSAVIIDAKTYQILFEKESNLMHLPASITKLMTALITLEKCSPSQIVTIEQVEVEGTQMGLSVGDRITVENLLYGLLINSGNDAAFALANACSDSLSQFVLSMNQKAADLEMVNTRFTNPAGFDDAFQYSTAADLARLANVATSNPLLAKIVATKSTVITDATGIKTYYLENINQLLGIVQGVEGIKTGQTEGALENLITRTTRNGNSIIAVILGSKDRFGESMQLIEWVFNNYHWVN
ncbi:hypothetical protein A2164_00505 [Candidatus Curtissbacteria bacterium RBG_13_35_7]|uniref:Peptidase S11 D-alanyl-D-alanine carboxypeptidase A N-terminal domain-containing protein n=1 Tax=Candidatus Curtissbacteria bacterium RBG_13_35_7 TaxID=1797705 RepID=A0A1F5G263_9BACT|nr:MAG: hypothetical protein A2164_00505 [Candidatus Curtissbacteria bacterium RBG_13_35_7]